MAACLCLRAHASRSPCLALPAAAGFLGHVRLANLPAASFFGVLGHACLASLGCGNFTRRPWSQLPIPPAAATFLGALGCGCPAYRLRQLFSATATFLDVLDPGCLVHRLRQLFSAPSVTPCPAHLAAATFLGALGHALPSPPAAATYLGAIDQACPASSGCGSFSRRLRTRRSGLPGQGRFSRTPAGHGRFPRTWILYLEYFWPFFLSRPKSPRQRRAAVGRSARPLQLPPTSAIV